MFETTFSHTSKTELPSSVPDETIIKTLHDFGSVIHTNPDCKGFQLGDEPPKNVEVPEGARVYDCEDSVSFLPKRLWSGGVWYKAVYKPVAEGCDITVVAPMGFTSLNYWRLSVDSDGKKYLSIDTTATCSRTFAFFVQKFTTGSHQDQHSNFKKRLLEVSSNEASGANAEPPQAE